MGGLKGALRGRAVGGEEGVCGDLWSCGGLWGGAVEPWGGCGGALCFYMGALWGCGWLYGSMGGSVGLWGLCGAVGGSMGLWGALWGCVCAVQQLPPPPPRSSTKRYNIMAFNAADKVNFSTWHQVGSRGHQGGHLGGVGSP